MEIQFISEFDKITFEDRLSKMSSTCGFPAPKNDIPSESNWPRPFNK